MSLFETVHLSGKEFIELNREKYEEALTAFSKLEIGDEMSIQIGFLTPSQDNDGRLSNSSGKVIEAYFDPFTKKIVIQNGNHRYREQMNDGTPNAHVKVKRMRNFHINY